jgi:serine/threonine protein kinase/formylglycine-generating enzyme required for sulfatase activity
VAKRRAKCPKCGGRLDYESAVDEKIVCPACQVLLSVPGKVKPSDKVDPLLGQSLGEFELVELLGRGGMGAVYKAKQPALDRFVAVKVLPRRLAADASFIERFSREARDAAAVSHPNIIQVLTVGQDKGFQFIAMEFVEGESLAEVLKRDGALPADRALELFRQVAAALAKAHAAGVVHRDIKPANILLTADGHAKLADFGLAKRTATDVTVTQTGAMMGTPLYFPPEAARSERFDARSDLYSLGATFYHLLAGKPPFAGDNAMMLAVKHANDPVPPLKQAAPDAPAALCGIIHRLLQKKAENRFQTADELLVALNSLSPSGSLSLRRPDSLSLRERAGVRAPGPGAAANDTLSLPPGAPHPPLSQRERAGNARRERAGTGTRPYILIGTAAAIVLVVVLVFALGPSGRVAQPPSAVVTPSPSTRTPIIEHPTPPIVPPAKKTEAPPKKEPTPEPPKPKPGPKKEEPSKPDRPKPEPKTTAKEDEDAKKEADEERQRQAEAAHRDALARAEAAYAPESEKVWAFFKERNYAEAEKLLAALPPNLPQVPNLREVISEHLKADQEASRLLKDFWVATGDGLAATKGKFLIVARAAGNLEEVKDGVIRIRTVKGEIEERPLTQLAGKQALHYFRQSAVGGSSLPREKARADLMAGVFLLAEGTALDEAAAALDKAGDGPSVAVYKERLNAVNMATAEAAAQKAWLRIQDEAKGKLSPALGKRLSDLLAEFEKKYAQTKFRTGLGDDLVELSSRVEYTLGYTKWPFDEAEAQRRQKATADALGVKVEQDIEIAKGVKMTFVLIPAGEFLMGSPTTISPEQLAKVWGGNADDYKGEFPQHRVKVSRPFWIGKYEVTQEQWMAVLQTNPSANKDKPKNPVESVDWNQASGFAMEVSEKLRKTVRLPTEAEWEYTCRAGTATEFYFGNHAAKLADFGGGGGGTTQPVGQKKPNAWGLYDMAGNVWEWVEDWEGKYKSGAQMVPKGAPAGGRRVLRGGSWVWEERYNPRYLRSAYRGADGPERLHANGGFRVVLVP